MFVYLRKKKVLSIFYSNKIGLAIKALSSNNSNNNTFIDSSANPLAITRTGNVSQGSFSPYNPNGYSCYLGTSTYCTIPATTNFDIINSNSTVEFWLNLDSYNPSGSQGMNIVTNMTSFAGGWELGFQGVGTITGLSLRSWNSGVTNTTTCLGINASNILLGVWNHIAVTREGSNNKFYLNGNLMGTYAAYTATAGSTLAIGVYQQNLSYPSWLRGKISNLRIVNGTAVYTSNFTPSTSKLLPVSGTVLLAFQDNNIKDRSVNNYTITSVGTPKILLSPFTSVPYNSSIHGGSAYFEGNGDSLTTPSSNVFGFGTGDFTAECYIYPLAVTSGTGMVLIDFRTGSGALAFNVYLETNGSIRFYANGPRITGAVLLPFQWYHIAAVRISGVTKLYLQGIQTGSSYTDSNNYIASARAQIGSDDDGVPNAYFNGYISSLRVLNGVGLYSSTFTPPTTPLTAIANTKLLCNFTNTFVFDATANTNLETLGGAKVSTTITKGGVASLYFDGINGSCVRTSPYALNAILSTDFIIDLWYYRLAGSSGTLYRSHDVSGNIPGLWLLDNNGTLTFNHSTNGISTNIIGAGGTLTTGTWHHIVHKRVGSLFSLYLNDSLVATATNSSGLYNPGTQSLSMAAIGGTSSTYVVTGYIEDAKITIG